MVNKVILVGRAGRDPEVRYINSGKKVANFSLATDEKWKDGSGNYQSKTEWHTIISWEKLAEICEQYIKKGMLVFVEGKIQTREWEDKNGGKRKTTEIVAHTIRMLDKKSQTSDNGIRDESDIPDGDDIPF